MKKTLFSLLALAAVLVFGASAYASTATTTMNVSLNSTAAVQVTATDMYFGNVVVGSYGNSQSTITVTAPSGTPCSISLDAGQHYGGFRCMTDGSKQISYELYKDTLLPWGDSDYAHTYPWGSSLPGTGTGAEQSYTVLGYTTSPSPAPGSYSDVVTVTVNY